MIQITENEYENLKRRAERCRELEAAAYASHSLYVTGDTGAPDVIKDGNGEVVLGLCKICNRAESQLEIHCDVAQLGDKTRTELKCNLAHANESLKWHQTRVERAYSERAYAVAAMARLALMLGYKAGMGNHIDASIKPMDDQWSTVCYISTPGGQVSYHIAPKDKHVFAGLPEYDGTWDGTFRSRDGSFCTWETTTLVSPVKAAFSAGYASHNKSGKTLAESWVAYMIYCMATGHSVKAYISTPEIALSAQRYKAIHWLAQQTAPLACAELCEAAGVSENAMGDDLDKLTDFILEHNPHILA